MTSERLRRIHYRYAACDAHLSGVSVIDCIDNTGWCVVHAEGFGRDCTWLLQSGRIAADTGLLPLFIRL
jgi:hypothetical protein